MTSHKDMTVDEWNAKHPEGTPVRFYPLRGSEEFEVTRTRSEAWLLGGGIPVVSVEGRLGGVSLEHLAVVCADGTADSPWDASPRGAAASKPGAQRPWNYDLRQDMGWTRIGAGAGGTVRCVGSRAFAEGMYFASVGDGVWIVRIRPYPDAYAAEVARGSYKGPLREGAAKAERAIDEAHDRHVAETIEPSVAEARRGAALRWKGIWGAGVDRYGRLCAEAVLDDDMAAARRHARRFGQCKTRFWSASARIASMRLTQEADAGEVDRYGEGDPR